MTTPHTIGLYAIIDTQGDIRELARTANQSTERSEVLDGLYPHGAPHRLTELISREDYDAVVRERDALRARIKDAPRAVRTIAPHPQALQNVRLAMVTLEPDE